MMKVKAFLVFFILFFVFTAPFCFAKPSRKPLSPLSINITPVQPGVTSDQIKPGEIADFKITAASRIDVPEMQITVDLLGGAKFVSGVTAWSGPAAKNEEKSIVITVQAPEQGKGRIKARASLPPSDGTRFSAEAQFVLGPETETKPEKEHRLTKDGKGRSIIEYR